MKLNRRDFMHLASLVLASTSLPVFGQAQGKDRRNFFVFFCVPQGWDITLSTDPQIRSAWNESDIFIEYQPEEIFREQSLALGPAAKPILPFAKDICVVNGVFMSDSNISHEANLKYMTSGHPEGSAASIVAQMEAQLQTPFGALFVGEPVELGKELVRIRSLQGLMDMASQKGMVHPNQRSTAFTVAQQGFARNRPLMDQFVSQRVNLRSTVGKHLNMESDPLIALVAAFVTHSAQTAAITVHESLDTHANHEGQHLANLHKVFDRLAALIKLLKATEYAGGSLFDATTIVVGSEFSRTAALNSTKGKDHNPMTNSVILIGRGIKGGQTIGASRVIPRDKSQDGMSHHRALLLDYATGQSVTTQEQEARASADFILPENIFATLSQCLGIPLNGVDPATPIIPGVLKA